VKTANHRKSQFHENIFLIQGADMTCTQTTQKNLRKRAIDNMGITLSTPSIDYDMRAIVRHHLAGLTQRELEICVLHFVDARSQTLIAEWLNLSLRTVQWHIENAVLKVPLLRPLCIQSQTKPTRPKLLHLSQLRPTERGPFNADEV